MVRIEGVAKSGRMFGVIMRQHLSVRLHSDGSNEMEATSVVVRAQPTSDSVVSELAEMRKGGGRYTGWDTKHKDLSEVKRSVVVAVRQPYLGWSLSVSYRITRFDTKEVSRSAIHRISVFRRMVKSQERIDGLRCDGPT